MRYELRKLLVFQGLSFFAGKNSVQIIFRKDVILRQIKYYGGPVMHIVEIPVYRISVQLESALRKKEYKEEHIAQAYGILSEKKKKQKTSVIILTVVIAALGLILGIGAIIGDNLVIGLISMLGLFVAAGVAGYIGYYNNVGKTAKQWNALLNEFYPDICSKYKL